MERAEASRETQEVVVKTVLEVRERLRAEFIEMPGLRLRAEQVQRLCGIERILCQTVLNELVSANFLRLKADGHYARSSDSEGSHIRKAELQTYPWVKRAS